MGFDKDNSATSQIMATMRSAASGIGTDIRPIEGPKGKKPKPKSPSATFLGADAEPGPASANNGGKTLLGM